MSLQFNVPASPYNGIIQRIEEEVYGMDGLARISGNTTLLGQWTTRVNLALDHVFSLIFESQGLWQFDDSNHTDYPTITTNLVANQRDYAFTVDENSNLILHIHAVYVAGDDGIFQKIEPVNELNVHAMNDGQSNTGTPFRYGKKANSIFLDPIPSYNETNGLKIEISREASYFTTADTTKKAGIAGLFHEYLALKPAFDYALSNDQATAGNLQNRVLDMETRIQEYYSKRPLDEEYAITTSPISHR